MGLRLFRTLYFFLFFGLSTIAGMLIPFLQHKGFNPIETGTLISLYTVSGMVGQFIVGYFCDKFKTIKKIFFPSILLIMISTTVSIVFNAKILFYLSFLVMGFCYSILTNLSDSWVMENEENIKSRYGSLRAFGSIGWAFGVLISGFIISKFGYYVINIMYIFSLSIAFIISFKLKDTVKNCNGAINFKELFINKQYILTIVILLIISISFRSYCQIVPYVIESRGGNTSSLGIFSFISSVSEIIMLVLCGKIMRKFSPDKLLMVVPVAMLVQVGVLYLATDMMIIYLSGILQIFTYPIILMVGRIMIDRVSPSNLKTSSQLIGFAIFNSLGVIIASISVGYLIENFSVNKSIMILVGFIVVGVLSTLFYDRKIKDKTL